MRKFIVAMYDDYEAELSASVVEAKSDYEAAWMHPELKSFCEKYGIKFDEVTKSLRLFIKDLNRNEVLLLVKPIA